MLRFQRHYFILTVVLFVIEMAIALFVHDKFIRPYLGDVLVVILLYCFVRAFFKVSIGNVCIGVLLFSYAIETAQYFNLVSRLGLASNRIARTIIGNSFGWEDLVAYTLGILLVLVAEKSIRQL